MQVNLKIVLTISGNYAIILMLLKGNRAGVAELADARDLKSREVTLVPVRPRPPAPI